MQRQNVANDAAMTCITQGIHAETVSYVQSRIPNNGRLNQLADFFKLFGRS